MRQAKVYVNNTLAGLLTELVLGNNYRFEYLEDYSGIPVSLTLPLNQKVYEFHEFPPFFDGLLQEGHQLEALLKLQKIDRNDLFTQLMAVGNDLVGNITLQ